MPIAFRSSCPVASALDYVGDKWTLIILRSIFDGRYRYSELADIPERIATNILADRLAWLEEIGLVRRQLYRDSPARYEYRLTRRGADFLPVLQSLARWSGKHIPECAARPQWRPDGRPEDFYPPN